MRNNDYSGDGYYFITVCTRNKKKYFGKMVNGRMILNQYGEIVEKCWYWLKKQYQYVQLDEYIVMPNHFHGILVIQRRDRSRPVPTTNINVPITRPVPAEKIKSLSELIGAFKTTSSKLIRNRGLNNFSWQRSFYDHIIRDEKSLDEIRYYIRYNPMKWSLDRENPENV